LIRVKYPRSGGRHDLHRRALSAGLDWRTEPSRPRRATGLPTARRRV